MMGRGILIACLVVAIQLASRCKASDATPPFKVVWNYPDAPCTALDIDFELDKFDLQHNAGSKYAGDTVAIFYSALAGKWPFIDFTDGGKYVNGGLPRYVDLPGHLAALKSAIEAIETPPAGGFSVIDMENWRPVFHTNYGRYTPYKDIFSALVEKEHPGLERQQLRRLGNKLWYNESLSLMLKSLEVAKETRPNEHWGYYGYPQFVTKNQNEMIPDLWQAITAYYPSIYIKTFEEGVENSRTEIKENIAESFRVRAEYGNPSDPIMPYAVVQFGSLGMFEGEWLRMEVRLPIEMGVDGVILWASSDEFIPPKPTCKAENEFVHNVLGPLITEEVNRMTSCSEELCAGRGRCVNKEYADTYPFLKTRGVPEDVLSTAQPSGVNAMSLADVSADFQTGYVCQCYDGSAGDRCTDAYEQ